MYKLKTHTSVVPAPQPPVRSHEVGCLQQARYFKVDHKLLLGVRQRLITIAATCVITASNERFTYSTLRRQRNYSAIGLIPALPRVHNRKLYYN